MRLMLSGTTPGLARHLERFGQFFGLLLAPNNRNSIAWAVSTGLPWACDNGCFHRLDEPKYRRMLSRLRGQPRLQWVVCPDKVADAKATLVLFDVWEPELREAGLPVAFVGQDGQEDLDLPWNRMAALFIGGSTEWKLSQAAGELIGEAKRRGLWVHMGRVNSRRRLRCAYYAGCDSVDGSFTRWGDKELRKMVRYRVEIAAQPSLF